MIRQGETKPWTKEEIPLGWYERYYDSFACDIIPAPGHENATDGEHTAIEVIHFMHSHRWISFQEISKTLHASHERLKSLHSRFIIHC